MKTQNLLALLCATTLGCALGCSAPSGDNQGEAVDIAQVRQDLATVADARIVFGHQSVGRNILAGVATLAEEAGVAIRIEEIREVPPDDAPGLFHANVGKNGDPESKCLAFDRLLNHPERPDYDLALMKFCYTDLGRNTPLEARAMVDRYATLVGDIRAQRPDVRLVHVTLPVVASPPGWKTPLKRLIGREITQDTDNALRATFNDALRALYADEPLFDLAAIESTRGNGSRMEISYDGRGIHVLVPEYTDDGQHLNPVAQRLAAAALLRTLGAALRGES